MSKISLKHSGGNVVSLNSPTSAPTSADVAFNLPNADGSNGQYMKTDGSGNLSFDTVTVPAGNIVFAEAVVDGGNGSPSVTRSTGFGSITDNGAGDYTLALSSAQADANYTVLVSAGYYADNQSAVNAVTERNQSNGNERANTTTAVNFGTVNSAHNGIDVYGNIFVACMRG